MISNNQSFIDWQNAFEAQRDLIEQNIVAQCCIYPSVNVTFSDTELQVSMLFHREYETNDLMRYLDCSLVFRFLKMQNRSQAVFEVTPEIIASTYDHSFGFSDYISPMSYEVVSEFKKTVAMDVEAFGEFLMAYHLDAMTAYEKAVAQAIKQYKSVDNKRLSQKLKELDSLGLCNESYVPMFEDRKNIDLSQWGEGAIAQILDAHLI